MKKSDNSWSVSDGSVVGYCLQEKITAEIKIFADTFRQNLIWVRRGKRIARSIFYGRKRSYFVVEWETDKRKAGAAEWREK